MLRMETDNMDRNAFEWIPQNSNRRCGRHKITWYNTLEGGKMGKIWNGFL